MNRLKFWVHETGQSQIDLPVSKQIINGQSSKVVSNGQCNPDKLRVLVNVHVEKERGTQNHKIYYRIVCVAD